jgi:hypothetical protein
MASTNILMSLSGIRFPLKCMADEPPRFMLAWAFFSPDSRRRFYGQIEHLEQGSIRSDQVFFYEGISGHDVIVYRKLEQGTDAVVRVEGQTLAVGNQDQEKVQEHLFLLEGRKKAIGEKTVGDKAEAPLNAPDPIGVENLLLDHD